MSELQVNLISKRGERISGRTMRVFRGSYMAGREGNSIESLIGR